RAPPGWPSPVPPSPLRLPATNPPDPVRTSPTADAPSPPARQLRRAPGCVRPQSALSPPMCRCRARGNSYGGDALEDHRHCCILSRMAGDTILREATMAELGRAVEGNLFALFRAMTALPGGELADGHVSRHFTFPTNPMFK